MKPESSQEDILPAAECATTSICTAGDGSNHRQPSRQPRQEDVGHHYSMNRDKLSGVFPRRDQWQLGQYWLRFSDEATHYKSRERSQEESRPPKEVPTDGDNGPAACKLLKMSDSYGCINNFPTDLPEEETSDSQMEHKQSMQASFAYG